MPSKVTVGCTGQPKGPPYTRLYRAGPSELGYLSWGRRYYGDHPIRESAHEGWHYFAVLAGSPDLLIDGRRYATSPGFVSVAHPDCPLGHIDVPGRECRMLTWIWRTPPTHSKLLPAPGGQLFLPVDRNRTGILRRLHAESREAVGLANEDGLLRLRALRIQLDLALARGAAHRERADGRFRFDLACEYLRQHMGERDPVRRLAEYLQISESSLKRLFRAHTGKTPRAFALEARMEWARRQLESGSPSVKAVAYSLGYRHANDFSRAFRRFHGATARRFIGLGADAPAPLGEVA
jgi:AraC-like DNA-binding protein